MTDEQLLNGVATAVGKAASAISPIVNLYKKSGQLYVYGKTRPYWLKEDGSFAVASSAEYLVDLKTEFVDFMRLRHVWTENGLLRPWTDAAFRRVYPDDTTTGEPSLYVPLDNRRIQLYPRPDDSYTIYVSYYYMPAFDTIADTPEEWQHIILHYILMMFDSEKWKGLFFDSLKDFVNEAKLTDEEDAELLIDDLNYDVKNVSDNLRR